MSAPADTIRVLAIDGGGVRGYAAADLLARVEDETQRYAREMFDVVAGTSTGGLIAAGIAGGRIRGARELADIYQDGAAAILPRTKTLRRLGTKQSRTEEFDGVLRKYMDDVKLKDAELDVVIPAFELTSRRATVFTRAAAIEADCDVLLRDVVVATSAAPTYLPPHKFTWCGQEGTFVDGGIFANNPSLLAWDFCHREYPGRPVSVLSIGTGVAEKAGSRQVPRFAIGELTELADVFSSATSSSTSILMESLAGDSYLRVNPIFTSRPTSLDDSTPEAMKEIRKAAELGWKKQREAVLEFLSR